MLLSDGIAVFSGRIIIPIAVCGWFGYLWQARGTVAGELCCNSNILLQNYVGDLQENTQSMTRSPVT